MSKKPKPTGATVLAKREATFGDAPATGGDVLKQRPPLPSAGGSYVRRPDGSLELEPPRLKPVVKEA
jgi:hypothetical protein